MTRSTRPGCLAVRYPAKLRAFVEMTTCSIFIDNTNPVVNPGHTGSSKDVGGACPLRVAPLKKVTEKFFKLTKRHKRMKFILMH